MSDVPQAPSLDIDGKDKMGDRRSTAELLADISGTTPSDKPAPAAAPDTKPTPAPPVETKADNNMNESVDEVLQQTTDQALRIAHLEEVLSEINGTIGDLRDEMHAGFAEQRVRVDDPQNVAGNASQTDALWQQGLLDRLDSVEDQNQKSSSRVGTILILAIVQLVILLVVAGISFMGGKKSAEPVVAVPSYLSAPPKLDEPKPAPAVEPPTKEVTKPEKRRGGKRGRRRR